MKENRVLKWDILKFILIFFVVLGHTIDYYTSSSQNLRALFLWIYSFHMPLFIFISGLFSKKTIKNNHYHKLFSYIILFYFTKILMSSVIWIITREFHFSLFTEDGTPWYAFALFAFYLITMLLKPFSKMYIFIASVILACFAGYDSSIGDFLVLSRIIVFYPFFFAGYALDPKEITVKLSNKYVRIISTIFLIVFTLFVYFNIENIYWTRYVLTARNSFSALGYYGKYGALLRILYYMGVFTIITAIISITPNRVDNSIIATLGTRSLQVYVLHPSILYILNSLNLMDKIRFIFPEHPNLLLVPIALAITLLCSLKFIEKPFKAIIFPKSNKY